MRKYTALAAVPIHHRHKLSEPDGPNTSDVLFIPRVLCVVHRYSILAPNAIPQGFVDGKQVTDKILSALQLDKAEYRLGTTKVFFKAGVLGMLEDMRDERLSKIIAMFQAFIRGYLMRKAYKKLQDQR